MIFLLRNWVLNSKAKQVEKDDFPELKVVKLPIKKHPKLKRLLHRGVRIYQPDNNDLRYFYAAHREGVFRKVIAGTQMKPAEFNEAFAAFVDQFTGFYAASLKQDKPLVLVPYIKSDIRIEIHAIWMPWASPRNKLESTVAMFKELSRWNTVITTVLDEDLDFYMHVRKYGILRYIGEMKKYTERHTGYLFQGVSIGA